MSLPTSPAQPDPNLTHKHSITRMDLVRGRIRALWLLRPFMAFLFTVFIINFWLTAKDVEATWIKIIVVLLFSTAVMMFLMGLMTILQFVMAQFESRAGYNRRKGNGINPRCRPC